LKIGVKGKKMEAITDDQNVKSVVNQAIETHGKSREAMIAILSDVNDAFGYIPTRAFHEITRQVNSPGEQAFVSQSQLFGLATFYQMLYIKPMGRHVIRFCESAPCHVMGGRVLFQALQDSLGIHPGETSSDGKWSFILTSCLGVCGVGPVLLVDDDIYGNVTPEQLESIFAGYD
jgi:NADH-quinone oxidoreductase subunit E